MARWLTLLRGTTEYGGKRRRCAPNILQARIIVLLAFQASHAVGQLSLRLLHPKHFALKPPVVVAGLERYAFRIHSLQALIPWWGFSVKESCPPLLIP